MKRTENSSKSGYTLIELLMVILIIALVAAIAIPSAVSIRNGLAFQHVNQSAKTVFLAAQSNLTEMRADGHLKLLQSGEDTAKIVPIANNAAFPGEYWSSEYRYCTSASAEFDLVLPHGAVEDVLRDQQILIEYNPFTGNVFGVFYSEGDEPLSYENITRDETLRRERNLGYYCGTGLSSSVMELSESKISIAYQNGEEGIVEVRVPIPDTYYDAPMEFARRLQTEIVIAGEAINRPQYDQNGEATAVRDEDVPLNSLAPIKLTEFEIEQGRYVVFTYALDSLLAGEGFGSRALSGELKGGKLSAAADETSFVILPGQNVSIHATAEFNVPGSANYDETVSDVVTISPDTEYGINPMFAYLTESSTEPGRYVLAVSNGRNLQNLNALSPSVAEKVVSVLILENVDWNKTVEHYSDRITENTSDVPLCDLPYFVPVHNAELFGTAEFLYPEKKVNDLAGLLEAIIAALRGQSDGDVPTLSDEIDTQIDPMTSWRDKDGVLQGNSFAENHAAILGMEGKKNLSNIRINTAKYREDLPEEYYVGAIDFTFTGVFSYVNTTVTDINLVNPVVQGSPFSSENGYNNPTTGALIGTAGYDTLLTGCGVYLDFEDPAFRSAYLTQGDYSATADQTWYGVSGEGAVGGLVGYAKSHRTTTGELNGDTEHLAFSNCFAAVSVSGNMRGADRRTLTDCDFGYSNGVGGLIGNSELTNFYNCYASGNVRANGVYVEETTMSSLLEWIQSFLGASTDLKFNGRHSMGAGGFVGTSHGTRYTNCFSTGNVDAVNANSDHGADSFLRFVFKNGWPTLEWVNDQYDYRQNGSGGFVGFMSYDETLLYGNDSSGVSIKQYTVFTDCYSVGCVSVGTAWDQTRNSLENFSGANGRVRLSFNKSSNFVGDYYELYAPLAYTGKTPNYEDYYIYRHSYYLSNYYVDAAAVGTENSDMCGMGVGYEILVDLTAKHRDDDGWVKERIDAIKALPTGNRQTYEVYFKNNNMTDTYKQLYHEGFVGDQWSHISASDTHCYDLENRGRAYPFTAISGMPYYGSWPEYTSSAGLAYYETYESGETAYYPLNDSAVVLDENSVVVNDGYAVFLANESAGAAEKQTSVRVKIGDRTVTLSVHETVLAPADSYAHSFNVFVLPRELMQIQPVDGEYYQEIRILCEDVTYVCYYQPNAAMTQVNPMDFEKTVVDGREVIAAEKPEKPETVLIRSARHFRYLSDLSSRLDKGVSFVQQLHVNRAAYTGQTLPSSVDPTSVTGSYRGGGYAAVTRIEGFAPKNTALFGEVTGTLANVEVVLNSVTVKGDETAAVVVGENRGTLKNVSLTAKSVTVTAEETCGALVGRSEGGKLEGLSVKADTVVLNAPVCGAICGEAIGDKTTVSDVTLRVETLSAPKADTLGASFGIGNGIALNTLRSSVGKLKAPSACVGGVVGDFSDGSMKNVTVSVESAEGDVVGGVTGRIFNVTVNNVTASVSRATGRCVYGGFGEIGVSSLHSVQLSVGTLVGEEAAAGVGDFARANNLAASQEITVSLLGSITAAEGRAAGFADHLRGSVLRCHVRLSDADTPVVISGKTAAGFAAVSSANVNGCTVSGCGSIRATEDASGFICRASGGSISSCIVTPVFAHKNADYQEDSLGALTVEGAASAGFLRYNSAAVQTSFALGTVTGENSAGFIVENRGSIDRCFANTSSASASFIQLNHSAVRNCYAWYTDSQADRLETTEGGTYYGCFFAPLLPQTQSNTFVTLYPGRGALAANGRTPIENAKLHTVTAEILNGTLSNAWKSGASVAYPFAEHLKGEKYPYPSFMTHYGDWSQLPRYAYGLVYYEEVLDQDGERINLQLVDLSQMNGKQNIYQKTLDFDNVNSGDAATVLNAGYAVFCGSVGQLYADGVELGEPLDENKLNLDGLTTVSAAEFLADYDLFVLNAQGGKTVRVYGTEEGVEASFIPAYARTINDKDGVYEIRTPAQFAAISLNTDKSFVQTRDVDLVGTSYAISAVQNYNGGNHTLITDSNLFNSVRGTVKDLRVTARDLVGSLFGKIVSGGKVTNVSANVARVTLGGTDGIFASENAGSITSCSVSNGTVSTTVLTSGLKNASIGGMVGENSGSLDGLRASVNLTIGANSSNLSVGGLVGKMTGGSLKNSSVSGAIERGTSVTTAVVGGAVGRDGTNKATYSAVTSNVTVDSDWFGMTTVNTSSNLPSSVVTPSGSGPIGAFVGYIYNGSFTDCSGSDPASKYHFVGELHAVRKTHASSPVFSGPLDSADLNNPYEYNESQGGYVGFEKHTAPFYQYQITNSDLVRCTFARPAATYRQTIEVVERYYTMKETVLEASKNVLGTSLKLDPTEVTYSDVYEADAGTYYYVTDGKCYAVSCRVSGFIIRTYTLYYQSGRNTVTIGSGNANTKAELYTVSMERGEQYVFTNGSYALSTQKTSYFGSSYSLSSSRYSSTSDVPQAQLWEYTEDGALKNLASGTYLNCTLRNGFSLGSAQELDISVSVENGASVSEGRVAGAVNVSCSVRSGYIQSTYYLYMSSTQSRVDTVEDSADATSFALRICTETPGSRTAVFTANGETDLLCSAVKDGREISSDEEGL